MKLTSVNLRVNDGAVTDGSLHFYDYENGSALSTTLSAAHREELNKLIFNWREAMVDTAASALEESKKNMLALPMRGVTDTEF